MSAFDQMSPATSGLTISLASDATLPAACRGVHVNVAGNIVGRMEHDVADMTYAVLAGCYYPYRFRVIRSAANGTTASGIVALY